KVATTAWSREGGTVRLALALLIPLSAALLQGTVAPLIAIGAARPSLPILVAGCWAVAAGAREAVWWAFLGGLASDLLSGGPLGAFALASLPPVAVVFSALTARLYDLEIVRGDYYHDLSEQNRILRLPVAAERGGITDRRGYVLARNVPGFAVSVIPVDLPRPRETELFQRLGAVLGLPSDAVGDAVRTQRQRNPYEPVRISKTPVPREIAFAITERAELFPGVRVDPE